MSSKTLIFCTFPTNVRKEESSGSNGSGGSGGSGGQGGASTRWRQTQISCWSSQDQGGGPLIGTNPVQTHHTQTNRHTEQPKKHHTQTNRHTEQHKKTPHRDKNTHRTTQKHTTHSKGGDDSDSDVTKYRIKTSKENCEFFQFLSRPGIAKVWN